MTGSHRDVPPPAAEELARMTTENALSKVAEVVRGRRTIGAFCPDPVPWEFVEQALELACWAPNHHKTEPWRFTSLGPATVRQVVELNAALVAAKKGADVAETKRRQWSRVPGWLLVTCVRSNDPLTQEEDYAACCCAMQNVMLGLWSQGVGSKWTTGDVTRDPAFFSLVQIDPTTERSVGLLWYGFPDAVPQQTRRPPGTFLRVLP
jgi:nitroreductase